MAQMLARSSSVACKAPSVARHAKRTICLAAPSEQKPEVSNDAAKVGPGQAHTEQLRNDAQATAAAAPPPPPPVSASSQSQALFGDVMAFSGAAPEVVNGRLAMLGFVAALGAELASDQTVLKQVSIEPTGIVAVFGLVIAGSLVTIMQRKEGKVSLGPFTASAELLNGRAAMVGFAAMLAIELFKGSALF